MYIRKKTWGPRKRDVTPKTVMSMTVEHAKDSLERKKVAVTCTLYEARSDEAKNITAAEVVSFNRSLDDDSRLFSVLPGNSAEIECVNTSYGLVPKGNVLSYHLSREILLQREKQSVNQSSGTKKLKVCDAQEQLMLTHETTALYKRQQEEGYDIPDLQYRAWLDMQLSSTTNTMTDIFQGLPLKKHVCGILEPTKRISFEDCQRIEQATIGQHLSSLWKDYHTKMINFKIICRRKEVSDAFVKWLLNPPDLSHIPAIQHGRQYEPTAAKAYQTLKSGVEDFKMTECGLVLHTEYSFLGASPDQLVCENGMFGLVEIKCPFSVYGRTIQEACQKPNFCCETCNATPSLKLDHEYYYQIQGQLAITGAE